MMAQSPTANPCPTVTEVDHIAAVLDPVIRNLQITQSYHELAVVMTARTGHNANWCTFATWASKQAGQTIRKEDLARVLETALRSTAVTAQAIPEVVTSAQALGSTRSPAAIQDAVAEALIPFTALDRASDAVARGNRKVYQEIGHEFARFYAACLHDLTFDPEKLDRFCEALRPGEPPDGQQYLRQAFAHYYHAFFEEDAKTRAEWLLLANLEIGFHEQTRLQPEITEAMNAVFMDRRQLRLRLLKALFPFHGWWVQVRLILLRLLGRPSPFDTLFERLLAEVQRQTRRVITEYLMVISLPGGVRIRLGDDIPAEFPPSLKQVVLPDLRTLLEKIDPTPDSTRDSGAVDWAHLPDRLHFILDLFRSYHEASDLFEPPFTTDQVTALKAGQVPKGRL